MNLEALQATLLDVYERTSSSQIFVYDRETYTTAYLAHEQVDSLKLHTFIRDVLAFLDSRRLNLGDHRTCFFNSATDEAVCYDSSRYLVFLVFKGHRLSRADVLDFIDSIVQHLDGDAIESDEPMEDAAENQKKSSDNYPKAS